MAPSPFRPGRRPTADGGGRGGWGRCAGAPVSSAIPHNCQLRHHRGQRVHAGPAAPQLGFQHRQLGVAGIHRRPVVRSAACSAGSVKMPVQPRAVLIGPRGARQSGRAAAAAR